MRTPKNQKTRTEVPAPVSSFEKFQARTITRAQILSVAYIPNRFAIRRTDNKANLGICAGMYSPLQNRDAFRFFDGIFGQDKARFEVAGVLGQGEKVWLLAKLPGDFRIAGDDVVGKWLLLTNGHDTNEPVRAKFTPIRVVCQNTLNAALSRQENEVRVVCQNTLNAALSRQENEVRVQHIGKVADKLEIAGKLLKTAGIYFDEVQAVFTGFTKHTLSRKALRAYARNIIAPKVEGDELSAQAEKAIVRIEELAETGRGADMKHVRGTLWGAYNAVTEYVDHDKTGESIGYMALGRGAEIKQRAFTVAQDMILAGN